MLTSLMRALPAGLLLLALTHTLPKGEWWWRASVLGVLNVGAFFPLLFLGAYRLPGGVAATIGAVQPLIVVWLARAKLGESVTPLKLGAGVAGVLGVGLLVLTPAAKLDTIGVVAALAGAVLMAVGVTLTKAWNPPAPALTLTAWQLTAGGLFLIPIALWEGPPREGFTWSAVGGYLWLGLVGTVVAYSLWFRGIARLEASIVTFLSLLTSITAAGIGWWWLGQSLTPLQLLGGAVALGAVTAVTLAGLRTRGRDVAPPHTEPRPHTLESQAAGQSQ
jgi:probable blue pigment (indigoidine) exporter